MNHNGRQLPPDLVSRLIAAYKTGRSAKSIAQEFGIHRTTVTTHLERHGVERRGLKKLTANQVAEAKRLRAKGLSYTKIAERFAVDKMTVWRAVNGR